MDYARLLTEGVGSWLRFESACDRSGLFSEKYLTHPIGQILSARSGNRALAEYKHPVLAQYAEGSGRRPEVDFVVCDEDRKVSIAVESKWIGRTEPSVQSILWDIIRLELLAHHQKARCFFFFFCRTGALEKLFTRGAFSGVSSHTPRKPLLRHDKNNLHNTDLVPTVQIRIPLLKELFSSYQNVEFPCEVASRRSQPFPLESKKSHYQIYTWEILSAKRRDIFYPRNSRHYAC